MELGEKIRAARLEAELSQRQLCGEEITRNMLSLIENGAAKPSVKTLRYLAQRLGKPLSYFLDDRAEENTALLTSFENLQKARQALAEGRQIYTAQLLENVTAPVLEREKLLLAAKIPGADLGQICEKLPSLDEELLLRARAALEQENLKRCAALLTAVEDRETAEFCLLAGRLYYARKEFSRAAEYLRRVEENSEVLTLLEGCCKALGDYRGAYEYACRRHAVKR